jgi:hypothetical protein
LLGEDEEIDPALCTGGLPDWAGPGDGRDFAGLAVSMPARPGRPARLLESDGQPNFSSGLCISLPPLVDPSAFAAAPAGAFQAVPEPSALGAVALAAGAMMTRRRRRSIARGR